MFGRTSGTSLDEKTPHDQTKDIDSTKDALSVDTDAILGLQQEKELTVGKAFWYYRKAVCWSIMICKSTAFETTVFPRLIVLQHWRTSWSLMTSSS